MSSRLLSMALAALGVAGAVGCQAHEPSMGDEPPVETPERRLAPEQQRAVLAHNRLGLEVLRKLPGAGNLACSPMSTASALGMLQLGARGETERALGAATGTDASSLPVLGALLSGVEGDEIEAAARVWVARDVPLDPAWTGASREHFGADPVNLDFTNVEQARGEINGWVADQTGQSIRTLIPAGMLEPSTPLVVTTAVHFDGRWQERFDPKETTPGAFHVGGGPAKDVIMMHATRTFRVGKVGDAGLIELPFEGGRFSMLILRPASADGLPALEASLTAEALEEGVAALQRHRVALALPFFALNAEVDLQAALTALGAGALFEAGQADLAGISAEPVFVQSLFQRAKITVDEDGAEASAATAAVVKRRSIPTVQPFAVDRPFIFAIRHQDSGLVVFMGRVADPLERPRAEDSMGEHDDGEPVPDR